MPNKKKAIILTATVLLSGTVFLLFFGILNNKKTAENKTAAKKPSGAKPANHSPFPVSKKIMEPFGEKFKKIPEQISALKNKNPEEPKSEEKKNTAGTQNKISPERQKLTQKPNTTPPPQPKQPSAKKSAITEREIFEKIIPPSYREKLNYFQDILISEKAIPPSEKSNLDNEKEVVSFVKKSIAYLKKAQIIDGATAERFMDYGIKQWENLLALDKKILMEGTAANLPSKNNITKKIIQFSCRPSNPFSAIAKTIISTIGGKNASAQCFQVGAGIGPIPGKDLWAPCCYCYCGKTACGCLNAVCIGRNAIWDPMTGICGCDT